MKINITTDLDKNSLKEAYDQALLDLDAMASISTNAEALDAIKKLAVHQKKIIKVLYKLIK